MAFAIIGGLVAIVIVALLVFQPTLELTRVKILFEEQLTDFVEAPVTLESVWLKPALWPTVGLRGLVIESSDTQSRTGFARLDSAELQLALLPLLKKQILVRRLSGEGVELRARRNRDKTGNWPAWTTSTYEIVELEGIELRDISADFVDGVSGDRASTHLDRLEAEIGQNDPLQLEMAGLLGETEYWLAASGPTLDDLFQRENRWPLELTLSLGEARLKLDGEIDPRPKGPGFDLLVAAEVSELDRMAARADLTMPAVGPLELRSRVTALNQVITISEIEARLGDSDISGSLEVDHSGEIPLLTGQLTAGHLDLNPWLAESDRDHSSKPAIQKSDDSNDSSFFANRFEALSTDVELRIERVSAPGPEIGDLSSRLQLEQGSLVVPIQLVLAGNTVRGELAAEGEDELHLRAELEAPGARVGEWAHQLADVQGIEGSVDSLRLRAESRGTTLDQLVERLAFDLQAGKADLAFGFKTESDPLAIAVDRLVLTQQAGSSIRLTAAGSLLEEGVSLSLNTRNLTEVLNDTALPLELELRAAGAEVLIEGSIDGASEGAGVDLDFQMSGDRVGDLNGLLGVSAEADLPYRIDGRLTSDGDGKRLRIDESFLGRSALTGELAWIEDSGAPLFIAELEASMVDPAGLDPTCRSGARGRHRQRRGGDRDATPAKRSLLRHSRHPSRGRSSAASTSRCHRPRDIDPLPTRQAGGVPFFSDPGRHLFSRRSWSRSERRATRGTAAVDGRRRRSRQPAGAGGARGRRRADGGAARRRLRGQRLYTQRALQPLRDTGHLAESPLACHRARHRRDPRSPHRSGRDHRSRAPAMEDRCGRNDR